MKLAMVFPYAPAYRGPIYSLIDKHFDIDWFFCKNSEHSLKLMDYSCLNSVDLSNEEILFKGSSFWYKGLISKDFKSYDAIIIAGQTHCLSEWILTFKYGHKHHAPKVFFWTHGWYGKETWLEKIMKRVLYHFCDGLLLYGDRAKRLMIEEGFDQEKLFVIHNSLDYESQIRIRDQIKASSIYKNHFHNNYPVLIFIGRLSKVKRLDMLIQAVHRLDLLDEKYNIVFVGDGSERTSLENLTKQYMLDSRVWFYGACYSEYENAEMLYNADLCVAPGNIGLTAIHSMTMGTPCMTHNCIEWQMPECEAICPGLTGSFFDYNDTESLASAIHHWFISNGTRRENIRNACYEVIDTQWNPFFQLRVLTNVLNMYKED